MVRGTTRQVVVVKGQNPKLFEQAIFLIRDEALANGGITEEALLAEARQACKENAASISIKSKLIWTFLGSFLTGIVWIISSLI